MNWQGCDVSCDNVMVKAAALLMVQLYDSLLSPTNSMQVRYCLNVADDETLRAMTVSRY